MTAQEAHWLERIIAEAALDVLFQPIVDAGRPGIYGYEALVRGPRASPLHSPLRLFEVATQAGMLVELDLLCRRLAVVRFTQLELPGFLFLNVMPLSIVERDFREGLTLGYVRQAGLSTERVVIELTEHVPIDDYALMRQAIDHYRDMGFRVALDDLGAGHSSLRHWAELRPDFVKLDRHFVAGIDQQPAKREFLRSLLGVGRNLNCRLIVEGIETAAEHLCLWELDRSLSLLQGFHFARPSREPPRHLTMPLPGAVCDGHTGAPGARAICQHVAAVSPNAAVLELAERFQRHSSLRCVAVVADDQPIGVLRRSSFLALFTNPFSHSLYARTQVLDVMDTHMLVARADTPLDALSQKLTERHDIEQEDFVIVENDGTYLGMGSIIDLLREITAVQVRQARHANPLTGLPGNILIQETLGQYLARDEGFAAVYVDLDSFKALNDVYGYACGDQVIVSLARLLQAQGESAGGFIGHIGGDDFMLLLPLAHWEQAIHQILRCFEKIAPTFYAEADRQRGGIKTDNRQGEALFVPFVSLSVAVKPVEPGTGYQPLDIASELSELKHQAKKIPGNSLFVERRAAADAQTTMQTSNHVIDLHQRVAE